MAVRRMGPGFDSEAYETHRPQEAEDAFVVSFEGAVLSTFERNHYDDSDFFAIVWDEEKQVVRTVEYATTRAWTYPNSATVDATDEVLAKARRWLGEYNAEQAIAEDHAEARRPQVGRKVVVTRGRTRGKHLLPTGTEGWVAAIVPGWSKINDVVLQVWEEGNGHLVYIGLDRVAVMDPEQYERDENEIREHAMRSAEKVEPGSGAWRSGEAWLYRALAKVAI